jgi:hypothetical protein
MAALRAQAKAVGMTPDAYASRLLEEAIALEQEARSTTFDLLFAPMQRRFRESAMSEAELDALVEAARKRHYRRTSRKKA